MMYSEHITYGRARERHLKDWADRVLSEEPCIGCGRREVSKVYGVCPQCRARAMWAPVSDSTIVAEEVQVCLG